MERTSTEKVWLLGSGAVGFVLVLVSYFFLISPQRSHTSSVNDQIAAAQTSNLGLQSRITQLNAEYAKLTSYKEQLHVTRLALPATSGMPAFLRTLQALGDQTGTSLTNLTVGDATAVAPPVVAAPPTGTTPSPTPSNSASATVAPTTGVYSIPLTATVSGSHDQLGKFLTQLQSVQPRAVLVTNITLTAPQPNANTTNTLSGGRSNLQLTMEAFVAPEAAAPAVTTTAPAGAYPSPSPSSSSAP